MNFPEKKVQTCNAESMQAVDILAFVEALEIPSLYFETPYTLSPAPGGETLYALLRETLRSTRKIGIAYVEIQTRQHLAALMPQGQSLVLTTLRWGSEDGGFDEDGLDDDDMLAAEYIDRFSPLDAPYREPASIGHLTALESDSAVLTEHNMKPKKSAGIVVHELDSLLDDDELIDDAYLEFALRHRPHSPDSHARRADDTFQPRAWRQRRGDRVRR